MIKQLRHQLLQVLLATSSREVRDILHTHPEARRTVNVVACADDSTEVQSLTLAHTPDAILLDATLPGALDIANSLLHLTLQHSCLLVMVTSDCPLDQLLRWLHVGACDILPSPLTADQIVSALIRACDTPRPFVSSVPVSANGAEATRMLLVSKTAGSGARLEEILQQHLEHHSVDQADSVARAVEHASARHYTVALIDADQVGRKAFDLAKQFRIQAPATGVVLLAARADIGKVRMAAQSGVCDYLLKPPTLDSLKAALVRARGRSEALIYTANSAKPIAPANSAVATPETLATPTPEAVPVQTTTALTLRGHVFTVYSPGGGNGATALACGLALALRQRDVRVALLDADLQFGNVAALLGVHTAVTLDQFVERIAFIRWPDEELAHHSSGLHVLPAPAGIVQGAMVSVEDLIRVVQRLRTYYEVLIVDAPHALNEHSVRLLKIADHILLPMRAWETQRQRIAALHKLLESRGFSLQRLHLIQSGFRRDPDIDAAAVLNLDVLAAQIAAGDLPDLEGLRELVDELMG